MLVAPLEVALMPPAEVPEGFEPPLLKPELPPASAPLLVEVEVAPPWLAVDCMFSPVVVEIELVLPACPLTAVATAPLDDSSAALFAGFASPGSCAFGSLHPSNSEQSQALRRVRSERCARSLREDIGLLHSIANVPVEDLGLRGLNRNEAAIERSPIVGKVEQPIQRARRRPNANGIVFSLSCADRSHWDKIGTRAQRGCRGDRAPPCPELSPGVDVLRPVVFASLQNDACSPERGQFLEMQ